MAGVNKGEVSGFIVEATMLVELELFWWTAAVCLQMLGWRFLLQVLH